MTQVEFEKKRDDTSSKPPLYVKGNGTMLVKLNGSDSSVQIDANVSAPGHYVIVAHYYQPQFPEFQLDVTIEDGQFYEAYLPVDFCPRYSNYTYLGHHNMGIRGANGAGEGGRELTRIILVGIAHYVKMFEVRAKG